MGTTVIIGIQGEGSASIPDFGIIASLLEQQTGIKLKAVPEDDVLLKMEWLKKGKIDSM